MQINTVVSTLKNLGVTILKSGLPYGVWRYVFRELDGSSSDTYPVVIGKAAGRVVPIVTALTLTIALIEKLYTKGYRAMHRKDVFDLIKHALQVYLAFQLWTMAYEGMALVSIEQPFWLYLVRAITSSLGAFLAEFSVNPSLTALFNWFYTEDTEEIHWRDHAITSGIDGGVFFSFSMIISWMESTLEAEREGEKVLDAAIFAIGVGVIRWLFDQINQACAPKASNDEEEQAGRSDPFLLPDREGSDSDLRVRSNSLTPNSEEGSIRATDRDDGPETSSDRRTTFPTAASEEETSDSGYQGLAEESGGTKSTWSQWIMSFFYNNELEDPEPKEVSQLSLMEEGRVGIDAPAN